MSYSATNFMNGLKFSPTIYETHNQFATYIYDQFIYQVFHDALTHTYVWTHIHNTLSLVTLILAILVNGSWIANNKLKPLIVQSIK